MTEREKHILAMRSIFRDIDKHVDRIKELQLEGRLFMLWIRDGQLTNDELVAKIEALQWWEDKHAKRSVD